MVCGLRPAPGSSSSGWLLALLQPLGLSLRALRFKSPCLTEAYYRGHSWLLLCWLLSVLFLYHCIRSTSQRSTHHKVNSCFIYSLLQIIQNSQHHKIQHSSPGLEETAFGFVALEATTNNTHNTKMLENTKLVFYCADLQNYNLTVSDKYLLHSIYNYAYWLIYSNINRNTKKLVGFFFE